MDVFDYLSKLRIYNGIFVIQNHYIIDHDYSSLIKVIDVDTGMKLVVYAFFPYQNSCRCTDVKNISLLNSWVISAQGNVDKNNGLFPRKTVTASADVQ